MLTACETSSNNIPPPQLIQPQACNPRVEAELRSEPQIPEEASIPQPVTEDEREGLALFLGFVSDALEWGREANTVAQIARQDCLER